MCSTCRHFKQVFPQLGRGKNDYYCQETVSQEEERDAAEFTKQSLREEAESNYWRGSGKDRKRWIVLSKRCYLKVQKMEGPFQSSWTSRGFCFLLTPFVRDTGARPILGNWDSQNSWVCWPWEGANRRKFWEGRVMRYRNWFLVQGYGGLRSTASLQCPPWWWERRDQSSFTVNRIGMGEEACIWKWISSWLGRNIEAAAS